MKRLLLAVSVLALTSGGVFAQNSTMPPAQSPAMPPSAAPSGGASSGAGTMGQAPKAKTMGHSYSRTAAKGHGSATVRRAQTALKQEGLYRGKVDGKFGPQTKSAVAQFQKQNGLKQTAQLDRATLGKLRRAGGSSGGAMPSGGSSGGGMPSGGGGSMPGYGGTH